MIDTSGWLRIVARLVCTTLVVLAVCATPAWSAPPPPREATNARAYITFDLESGVVVSAKNERTPTLAASTFKVVTALVVRANVDLTTTVPVSQRATDVPALKLSLQAGEKWNANGLLHAMLIASLNDAAFALAEASGGGSLEGFTEALAAHGRRLGFADSPVLRDPAGLDDEFAHHGGNRISARDLAIATRAFMADPLLASIVKMPSYSFAGGDGEPHRVVSHNAFLATYPGAIGVKTGYTERAGNCLIAAATRGNRTFGVVVLGADDPVAVATEQLDHAFATASKPMDEAVHTDRLPAIGISQTTLAAKKAPTARQAVMHAQIPLRGAPKAPVVAGFVVAAGLALSMAGRVRNRGRRTPTHQ